MVVEAEDKENSSTENEDGSSMSKDGSIYEVESGLESDEECNDEEGSESYSDDLRELQRDLRDLDDPSIHK